MTVYLTFLLAAIIAFFLGSIPGGILIGKIFYRTDIREVGSGNIGTTNAIRALGKVGGYGVFVIDFTKGLLSGLIAGYLASIALGGQAAANSGLNIADFLALAFAFCVWGHIFCPWLNFKGGKGIAVAVGCLFATFGPIGAILELASFGIVVVLSKYVSAGSIVAAALCPFFALYYFWGDWLAVILCTAGALTVLWAHRGNIQRLLSGTERKLGQ